MRYAAIKCTFPIKSSATMSKRGAQDKMPSKNHDDAKRHKDTKKNKEKALQQLEHSDSEPEDGELVSNNKQNSRSQTALKNERALDPEELQALGSTDRELSLYGEDIHSTLPVRWEPILRDGMTVEAKESILKDVAIPGNCKLLKAPTLNPETDIGSGDHYYEDRQQQLGQGITLVSRGLGMVFELTGSQKTEAMKLLSNACRVLCDLHYLETKNRRRLISRDTRIKGGLHNILKHSKHDEYLFGSDLSDKIREANAANGNQGVDIQINDPRPSTSQAHPSVSYEDNKNYRGPARLSKKSRGQRDSRQH